jgi:hypothetical protein
MEKVKIIESMIDKENLIKTEQCLDMCETKRLSTNLITIINGDVKENTKYCIPCY